LGGIIGDRLQRRTCAAAVWSPRSASRCRIPFYVVLFFVPLRLDMPLDVGKGGVVVGMLRSLVTEPVMAASFLLAAVRARAHVGQLPNWYALIAEANLPEHRANGVQPRQPGNGAGRATGHRPGRGYVRRWSGPRGPR
jgi:hypothetical protein